MYFLKLTLTWLFLVTLFVTGTFFVLAAVPLPDHITYGVTFSKLRADELNLDWRETYHALLNELGVKRLRLIAHWPMVEPKEGQYDFSALDYQLRVAESHGAHVILAIGRRLPSWPECHVPEWAKNLDSATQNMKLLAYMTAVVERYKNSPALHYWQVENEPFIIGYAYQNCGETDATLLHEEVTLVHELDPAHPVVLTASGELGLWNRTWRMADIFGTTLYREVWNLDLNSYIRYPTTPAFFRAKYRITRLIEGPKPAIISELAAEPWPVGRIVDTPLSIQIEHMSLAMLEDTIHFAAATPFSEQYLWGAEWWYYMKTVQQHPEYWEYAKAIFHD